METAQVLESAPLEDPPASFPLSTPARALLAVLSIGAATIHLVMVPSHAGESLIEGLGFAVAGWLQLGFAIAVVARPTKRWLGVAVVSNVAFIAVWAITRTVGLPFGAHPGHPEAASFIDMACVGLEAALILAAFVLVRQPRLGEHLDTKALVMASIIPLGVIVLTTTVLASPSARNHSANGHGDHDEVSTAAGAAGADHHGSDSSMAGMDHSNTGADHDNPAASASGDHAHAGGEVAAPAAADRCDWEFNTTAFWAANPPTFDDGTHTHMHEEGKAASAGADATVGNKAGLQVWPPMTDPAKCAKLKADLAIMDSMQKKYPTAADAVAAGCIRVTIYVPGIAAHYACFKNWDDKMDVEKPEMLLYGGSQPWAPLVGLSYYSTAATQPGAEWEFGMMPFHVHAGLCVKGTLVIGGDGSDKAGCEARGGKVMGKTGFMGHYWNPNCSSPDGVFSAENPRLTIGVANVNDDPKYDPAQGGDPTILQKDPCAGSTMTEKPPFGRPGAAGTTESASAPTGATTK